MENFVTLDSCCVLLSNSPHPAPFYNIPLQCYNIVSEYISEPKRTVRPLHLHRIRMNMKISLFLTFLIGSVVTVAADDHRDHSDNNKKKMNLRASPGSTAAQGTTFALFHGKLETDSSLTFDDQTIMTLDEEMEEVLQGMNEVERSIQLAAYKDFKQKSMSLEEINKKYLPHGDGNLDVGTKTIVSIRCCRDRFSDKCGGLFQSCKKECRWGSKYDHRNRYNHCCHPSDRGEKFWVWEDCK